ncbi:MAG: hypothetical protein SNJ29_17095, partial [Rikenellaceae bacterium]
HASKFIFSTHSAKVGIIILLGGLNAYTYATICERIIGVSFCVKTSFEGCDVYIIKTGSI